MCHAFINALHPVCQHLFAYASTNELGATQMVLVYDFSILSIHVLYCCTHRKANIDSAWRKIRNKDEDGIKSKSKSNEPLHFSPLYPPPSSLLPASPPTNSSSTETTMTDAEGHENLCQACYSLNCALASVHPLSNALDISPKHGAPAHTTNTFYFNIVLGTSKRLRSREPSWY